MRDVREHLLGPCALCVFCQVARLAQHGCKTAGGKASRLLMFVLALEDVLLRFTYQAPTCVPLFALLLTLATRQPTKLSQAYWSPHMTITSCSAIENILNYAA